MEKWDGLKVFKVEIGVFDYRFALAKGFDEAAEKVRQKVEHERAVDTSILDNDGSLKKLDGQKEVRIKNVELLSDELIF